MKKIITILLLLIISVQCLPIKEIGKALFDSSFVEDDVCNKVVEKKELKEYNKEFYFTPDAELIKFSAVSTDFCSKNSTLFLAPVTDVTTPPPIA